MAEEPKAAVMEVNPVGISEGAKTSDFYRTKNIPGIQSMIHICLLLIYSIVHVYNENIGAPTIVYNIYSTN